MERTIILSAGSDGRRIRGSAALCCLALLALTPPSPASAGALWSVNGATISNSAGNQLLGLGPGMSVSDGSGGAYFVWIDSRNFATDGINVYALRLDSSGNPATGWTANGVRISTTPTRNGMNAAFAGQIMPAVSGDGAGGIVITWQDFRSGEGDVYAQRVGPTGTKLWGDWGVIVSSGPTLGGEQGGGPYLADNGGIFVIFYERRGV